ncbi:ABC transporter, periplasmic binding protein [Azotobacter vinelandii CA]|uniref:ABC transporter, periplasmic binding protein n=3 Tax=Azotobacter vinelandii TaxID=354 RepID=C1DFY5_AZOVD|nr:ABC transporter substrate-binding protein [Azotobacter vinelandii]ACO76312.1 ABC transporter, periplasmic binding protein [Azotobacter vinelandii DJ]AGK15715.1 ABC transporter, periplasmic binding protein [Azotobacter vinelandii CA]AGK19028.1 ABC transporter, periplasmic binding protein [Azotobacter vinelandii CA6]SFX30011.1 iron complex transport system substrate-binding protein [Azotobacter vinelandii]GLK59381.1 ABC transporter substrate-binding protein [Azotobacter vinelandii]
MMKSVSCPRFGLFLLLGLSLATAQARQLTDMSGRTEEIPERPQRVFPAVTMMTPVMAALAPELMTGLAFRLAPGAEAFLPAGVAGLPVVPVLEDMNAEAILVMRPDLAIGWSGAGPLMRRTETLMQRLRIPALFYKGERLDEYPATFRALGDALGRKVRGERLARYLEDSQVRLRQALRDLPESERPRVYYAESPDGLTTQCDSTSRMEVIRLAGGVPALSCADKGFATSREVDFETLLELDPDVVVARNPDSAARLRGEPRWQLLRAVREGRVYGIPELPFNWFDRPPSFMRALGAHWLARLLHPRRFDEDIRSEAVRFNQVFFGIEPPAAALDRLLEPRS